MPSYAKLGSPWFNWLEINRVNAQVTVRGNKGSVILATLLKGRGKASEQTQQPFKVALKQPTEVSPQIPNQLPKMKAYKKMPRALGLPEVAL